MKTLIALIKDNAWLSIELTLLDLYPDEKENIEGYQKMFNQLQLISPAPTNISIVVKWENLSISMSLPTLRKKKRYSKFEREIYGND